jgi:hypothetical protein
MSLEISRYEMLFINVDDVERGIVFPESGS